jgi:predicted metal-dependent HD superfamily phosphohydrolase
MDILTKVEGFVTDLYKNKTPETLFFHRIDHTREVVEASRLIGKETKLTVDELEVLLISAWFHDVGYTNNSKKHEEVSIEVASQFLQAEGYESQKLQKVLDCIAATEVPQEPTNTMEAVLCDADMFHLSQDDFPGKTLLIRKEMNALLDDRLNKTEYLQITIDFFNAHTYHTEYGKEVLSPGKEKNKEKLIQRLEKRLKKLKKGKKNKTVKKHKKSEIKSENSEKIKSPTRGVESMFRLTANNQISLSSIADNKANILITVNSIILSLIITWLFEKFGEYPKLVIPTLIFLLSSLVTIVFAILTTRPKVSSGTFTKEELDSKNVNLLFFGNFYNMSLQDYEWAIKDMMKDYDGLYGNMIKDQYYLGKVLAKKYKRLRIAYNIFMFGIIFSVLVFIVTTLLFII